MKLTRTITGSKDELLAELAEMQRQADGSNLTAERAEDRRFYGGEAQGLLRATSLVRDWELPTEGDLETALVELSGEYPDFYTWGFADIARQLWQALEAATARRARRGPDPREVVPGDAGG